MPSSNAPAPLTTAPVDPYLPDAPAAGLLPRHYDLDLTVNLGSNRLTGTAVITADVPEKTSEFVLDLVGLKVKTVTVSGQQVAKTRQVKDRLIVTLKKSVSAGSEVTVKVAYEGSPGPRRGLWGDVGWEELTDGVLVAGQPNGAPTWFPCVDHPAVKATFRIAVWADAGYRVIANGQLVDTAKKGSSHRWVYEERHPTSTYLAALQIGRYDVVESDGVVGFAASNATARRARTALKDQRAMFDFFSDRFGPYPFTTYTSVVSDDTLEIPLEAMEMSLFGLNHMTGSWENQRLIAHEMAHQWWGNAVTVRQWMHVWLHEGFACYAEWLWSEESGHSTADAQAHRAWLGLKFKAKDLLLADPGAEDMFDDRVYKRGALTLHALRARLGDQRFFTALRALQSAFRDSVLTTDEALTVLSEAAGDDGLRDAVTPWLFETALPPFPAADAAA